MAVPVHIFISTDDVPSTFLEDVLVQVYDSAGVILITSGTTDVNGMVEFLLEGAIAYGGQEYQLRLFKLGVSFQSPQYIQVVEPEDPGTPNDFDLYGHLLEGVGEALDPRFCRLYTTLIHNDGTPISNGRVRLRLDRSPVALGPGSYMVVAKGKDIYADANGVVFADMIRGGIYSVRIDGFEDYIFTVHVPDRARHELSKCLFVRPAQLSMSPAVINLAIEETEDVDISLLLSDTREVSGIAALSWITLTFDDSVAGVITYRWEGEGMRVTGAKPGTCTISAVVKSDATDEVLPEPELVVTEVAITVH